MVVVSGVTFFCCAELVSAQILTPMYTFESGLQGFAPNGVASTVTLNTDISFVSEGSQSMKVAPL